MSPVGRYALSWASSAVLQRAAPLKEVGGRGAEERGIGGVEGLPRICRFSRSVIWNFRASVRFTVGIAGGFESTAKRSSVVRDVYGQHRYSSRSAFIGSRREARIAGIRVAGSATNDSSKTERAMVSGSVGLSP